MTLEVARSFEQLMYCVLLCQIYAEDGITGDARQLADAVGIPDIDSLGDLAEETGDDVSSLLAHPVFRDDPPHACFEDDSLYPGDFPHPGMALTPEALRHVCGYEVHSRFGQGKPDPLRFRQRVGALETAPRWLRSTRQPPVFQDLLNQGDLLGAWMSLNSPGWTYAEARKAITVLAASAQDEDFSLMATAWVSLPHPESETY